MKFKKTTFSNGLRLVTHNIPDTKTVTITVFVKTGSDYERENEMGLSHFLEHMCFKGTKNRPSNIEMLRELDMLGAQNNAFTSNDITAYWVKGESKHIDKLFDIVSDIYLNPTFPEAEIEKEKGVVLEEINMYNDRPQTVVYEAFLSLMYGNQPVGRMTIGTRESVKSFTKNDLQKYHSLQYVPSRTIISIAGDIDEKKAKDLVKKYFKIDGSSKGREKLKPKTNKDQNRTKHIFRKTDQTHIVLGYPGVSVFDKGSHIYDLLARILTGGMSSRLFVLLREELGVAYYVRSYSDQSLHHGTFLIAAGITTEKAPFVVQKIQEVVLDIAQNGVPDEELERAKNSLAGGVHMSLETSDAISVYLGEQELMRQKIETPKEYEKNIRKITSKEIQKVAKKLSKKGLARLASIGPQKDDSAFAKVLF